MYFITSAHSSWNRHSLEIVVLKHQWQRSLVVGIGMGRTSICYRKCCDANARSRLPALSGTAEGLVGRKSEHGLQVTQPGRVRPYLEV